MRSFLPVFLLAFLTCGSLSAAEQTIRIATFNIAMGLEQACDMETALESGHDRRLQKLAEELQTVRPANVLLKVFDYHPPTDEAGLRNEN